MPNCCSALENQAAKPSENDTLRGYRQALIQSILSPLGRQSIRSDWWHAKVQTWLLSSQKQRKQEQQKSISSVLSQNRWHFRNNFHLNNNLSAQCFVRAMFCSCNSDRFQAYVKTRKRVLLTMRLKKL